MFLNWIKRVLRRMKKKSLTKNADVSQIRLTKANRLKSTNTLNGEVCEEDDISSNDSTLDFSDENVASAEDLDKCLESLRSKMRVQRIGLENNFEEQSELMLENIIAVDRDAIIKNLILNTHSQTYSSTFNFSKVPSIYPNDGFYSSRPYSQAATRYRFRSSIAASAFYQSSTSGYSTVLFQQTFEEDISFDESQQSST
uniref:Uncharacterized protein n=1 Tax=Panagrolaimus sp. JU765 TaxID=591449 RepID=A0AC34QPN5_9BILA